MATLVIKVEVEVGDFEVDLFSLKDDFAMDTQADFVKDALRDPNNKIDWDISEDHTRWIQRVAQQLKDGVSY